MFAQEPATKQADAPAAKKADTPVAKADPIAKIKTEVEKNSKVMETLSYLSDVIGPRLTNSTGMKRANEWTRDKLTEFGIENAHLEPWGPFGTGWTLKKFTLQVTEPQCIPLIAYPKAWSPGTDGPVTGPVVFFNVKEEADFEKYKGKLKGAIVLSSAIREVAPRFEALAIRKTDTDLLNMANASSPTGGRRGGRPPGAPAAGGPGADAGRQMPAGFVLNGKKLKFFVEEGVAAVLDPSSIGDAGTLFVSQASVPGATSPGPGGPPAAAAAPPGGAPPARRPSAWDKEAPKNVTQVVVSKEQYNRLVRMVQAGEKLTVTLDLAVEFQDKDLMGYNTVAEIPGTDLKDEVVMLGGHLDSWHSGTGATDNAAGCSVGMEALRIIKALDLKPRRTIRIALWSGEEQGLLGSRGYVKEHFGYLGDGTQGAALGAMAGGPPAKLTTKPEYEKFSSYFNFDNGGGKIRGIYLQGNEAVRPIFREWLQPFRDMGASTITISNTGGTDHQSFDGIGLPGFQFIQDDLDYDTRTHHSNMDVFDRILSEDMKQASMIMAAFVYNAAMRDEKLPRKPAPGAPSTSTAAIDLR